LLQRIDFLACHALGKSAGHTLIWESMYEKVGSARFFYCLFAGDGSHNAAGTR